MDTWRIWELVLPALERRHDVLAVTLAGHAGGPPISGELTDRTLVAGVEQAMDDAGFERAHLVGNSLGGWIALQLAARGRADSVVAFAPAGGWARGDESFRALLTLQGRIHEQVRAIAPQAEAILATPEGRRRATQFTTVNYEHIPVDLLAHQMLGVAACQAEPLLDFGLRADWTLDAERIDCPVRIVWGTEDRLLAWPSAAVRYRHDWLPHADWVELDGVGHCPQLDVPVAAAQLVLDFTKER
jgi:pimeloyl-ACP methyl ester carboxylesterase